MIVKHCQLHFKKFSEEKQKEQKEQAKKKEREEQRKKENEEKSHQEAAKISSKTKSEEDEIKKKKEEEEKKKAEESAALVEKAVDKPAENGEKKEEDTGPAPIGNGGSTDKYTWTQTLEELHMYIPVDNEVKGKSLKVNLETNRLFVIFFFIQSKTNFCLGGCCWQRTHH